MQKHPKMSLALIGPLCPFYGAVLMQPIQLSPYAFNRYLRKQARCYTSIPNVRVYGLPCGCYVWVHSSGVRQLSALPF